MISIYIGGALLGARRLGLATGSCHCLLLFISTNVQQINDVLYIHQEDPPSLEEAVELIKNLKMNKSPGSDEVTAEMYRNGGEELSEHIHKLIAEIWKQEQMPEDGRSRKDFGNYRGIALLNVAYKILSSIKNKLTKRMEEIVGEYQCGFRKRRGVMNQIFTLKEIQAKNYEKQHPVNVLFIDFKKAYDTVIRSEVLENLGVYRKLINLVKMTLQHTENRVKVNGRMSRKFEVKLGLRQGDPLSTILFNFVLEKNYKRCPAK